MKEYYISMNKEKMIDDLMWEENEDNYENGHREVHIWPHRFETCGNNKGQKDNPSPEASHFIQSGNWYGPDVNTSNISMFSILDFFDITELDREAPELGYYSETRADAETDWLESHDIDVDDEDAIEKAEKEHNGEINNQIAGWVDDAVLYDREVACSCLVSMVLDEKQKILYNIIWED